MEFGVKLTFIDYDNLFNVNRDDLLLSDVHSYRRLIGRLLYLTITRPDIGMTVFEIIWIKGLLSELSVDHNNPVMIFSDNKAA